MKQKLHELSQSSIGSARGDAEPRSMGKGEQSVILPCTVTSSRTINCAIVLVIFHPTGTILRHSECNGLDTPSRRTTPSAVEWHQ